MQSHASSKLHVGIIMDGNGRWATRRRLSRLRGHEAGVEAIRRVVEAAPQQGIGTLTLYAFSSDNWRRPKAEVSALMGLLRFYLANEVESLVRNGVRLTVIGRRDRLPDGIAAAIASAETATAGGDALHLRIAVDYSARDAILNAVAKAASVGRERCVAKPARQLRSVRSNRDGRTWRSCGCRVGQAFGYRHHRRRREIAARRKRARRQL